MAMRQTDGYEPLEGEIVYPVQIPYQSPPMKIPEPPRTEVQRTGFLGLQQDPLDKESRRRKKDMHNAGVELAYRRSLAAALDAVNEHHVTQAMARMEAHVNSLPAGSLVQRVSADIAAASASRQVLGVMDDGELFNSISSNTILRRR